jgi:high-affinity iron transporter
MFATALIVFRETLEAALFIGIIAGCFGAFGVALTIERISVLGGGLGQDYLNVGLISLALFMLIWHCVWVSTHSQETVQKAKRLGIAAKSGSNSLWALSIAVALTVLREGAEVVVFVSGFTSGSVQSLASLLIGVVIGLLSGVVCGFLIYTGLSKIKAQHFFAVTNVWVLIMAGALAAHLAKALIQSGLVRHWTDPLWDTSFILSIDSPLGNVLRALIGYDASPSGLQILFYLGTLIFIPFAARQAKRLANEAQASTKL